MRLTNILFKQHNVWRAKLKWKYQSQRNVLDTGLVAALEKKGITVKDAVEYTNKMNKFAKTNPEKKVEPEINHPITYIYGDSNCLVYGCSQAQVLTKTLIFDKFPEKLEKKFASLKLPTDIERSMHQSVLVSHLLDAEQIKSPYKIPIAPHKPRHFLPKEYCITERRKNLLISTRLLNHCERFYGHIEAVNKKTVNDVKFMAPIEKNGDRVQFNLSAETFVTSKKPIAPFDGSSDQSVPDIYPLDQTVSIPKIETKYDLTSSYPIKTTSIFSHPHTIMLHYSKNDVKHLFEEEVTHDQFESRAILKGFAVATSRAHSLYGLDVKILQQPIAIQVVQLDGRKIQFGIFQLNTLDLDSKDGVKNFWFRKPDMFLYDECIYKDGRPLLSNYNFDIFKMMCVFYSN
ncbi:hypothetical protein PVAND_000623 [Polypedilum vanderplanki]|uniref:39S ribosomal protein L37, mitochondrial n=1 Tax=Polypedilum vanderplanki TaxID=319348 RepID=A0A9J6BKP5_POLVA|nr:hypothetical protein PVAND_000623 [Polypedilum vanderplanki]